MANKVAVFDFNGPIASKDEAVWFGLTEYVSAEMIAKFIEDNKEANTLVFKISSPGGNADQAFEMVDRINATKKIIQTVGFQVHSAATLVFVSGDERLISKNAGFTPHNAAFGYLGDERLTKEVLRENADELENYDNKMLDIYAERLGLDEEKKTALAALMAEDKNIGSDGAIELGFATGLYKDEGQIAALVPMNWTKRIAASIMDKKNNDKNSDMNKEQKTLIEKAIALLTPMDKKLGIAAEGDTAVVATTTALSDGTSVYSDGPIAVDSKVYSDEAMTTALADGEYELEDLSKITVAAGVVKAITDAPAASASTDAKDTEIAALKAQLAEKEAATAKLKTDVTAIMATVTELQKMVPGGGNPNGDEENNEPVKATYNAANIMATIRKKTGK